MKSRSQTHEENLKIEFKPIDTKSALPTTLQSIGENLLPGSGFLAYK